MSLVLDSMITTENVILNAIFFPDIYCKDSPSTQNAKWKLRSDFRTEEKAKSASAAGCSVR